MWLESDVYREDLESIVKDPSIAWDQLEGKTILVTGATGLIGQTVVNALLYYGMNNQMPPIVYALVRNEKKAHTLFHAQEEVCKSCLRYIIGDVETAADFPDRLDYIIHCASQTASSAFVSYPVETLSTAIHGTENMLRLANNRQITGMVYLSSMEVYGSPERGHYVTEKEVAGFDPTTVRNCYPISKIVCESLCNAYAHEYGVPVKTVRLTQTMGPGVARDDKRVFAEFMRCVLNDQNIVLKTKGETERCYLYTADAVRAILVVLLKGINANAYSVANEETYCSIAQMADLVCTSLGNGESKVVYDIKNASALGYADTLFLRLNTRKIRELGWEPKVNLKEMYIRMARLFEQERLQ